ncbi:MAG TPA: hydrogenase maturation protease [Phycisphaerae bacterium]|nr:hydrogenase maturation protease [Phycisphaerae bacterium]
MNEQALKVLLIGYGNPGRGDDGLGPALAARIERLGLAGITIESDYQLCLEDGEAVARHDVAIFADADTTGEEPFSFRRVEPASSISFSTHSLRPEAVLGLAHDLFGARTEGYVLGIRGYDFNEFNESLSGRARANLELAAVFTEQVCREGDFARAAGAGKSLVASVAPVTIE